MVTPATSLPIPNLGSNDPGNGATLSREDKTDGNPADFATALVQAQSQRNAPTSARPAKSPTTPTTAPHADDDSETPATETDSPGTPAETAPTAANGKEATKQEDVPVTAQPTENATPIPPIPYAMLMVGLATTVPVAATNVPGEETTPTPGNAIPGGKSATPGNVPPVLLSSATPGSPTTQVLSEASPVLLPSVQLPTGQAAPIANGAPSPTQPTIASGASMDSNAAHPAASGVELPTVSPLPNLSSGADPVILSAQTPVLPQSSPASMATPMATPIQAPIPVTSAQRDTTTPLPATAPATALPSIAPTTAAIVPAATAVSAPSSVVPAATLPGATATTPTPTPALVSGTETPVPAQSQTSPLVGTTQAGETQPSATPLQATLTSETAQNAVRVSTTQPNSTPTQAAAAPSEQTANAPIAIVAPAAESQPTADTRPAQSTAQRLDTLDRLKVIGQPARTGAPAAQPKTAAPVPPPAQNDASTTSGPTLPEITQSHTETGQLDPGLRTQNAVNAVPVASAFTSKTAAPQPALQTGEPVVPPTVSSLTQPMAVVSLSEQNAALVGQAVTATPGRSGASHADGLPSSQSDATAISTGSTSLATPLTSQDSASAGSEQDSTPSKEERSSNTASAARETTTPTVGADPRSTTNSVNTTAPVAHDTSASSNAERIRIVEQVTRHIESLHTPIGRGEMTLRLQPEHLGSLRLTISSQSNGVVARIVAETTQVQQALESHKNSLQAALEGKGLRLNSLDVSVGQQSVPDGRAGFASQQNLGQQRGTLPSALRTSANSAEPENIVAPVSRQIGLDPRTSRLDYRA